MKGGWGKVLAVAMAVALLAAVPANVGAAASPVFPIEGKWVLTSPFGYRTHPVTGNRDFHEGADLGVPEGTPVRAALGGVVAQAGWRGGYGYAVEINHGNGYSTLYAHLSRVLVAPGTPVAAGQVIALSGNTGRSTGPHLHFEVRYNGRPVDPAQWFPALSGGKGTYGIGPTPPPTTGSGAAGIATGLATEILSGLRGEINQWLVGVFLSLLLMVILPAQALTDFGGMLEAIKSGNWNIGGPTPLFPWRLDVSGGVSGLAVTVGVILWLFAVLRGARRMMEGEESPLPVIQALVANLALVVAAPLIVRAGAAIYNTAYRSILDVLPAPIRHNTAHLLWSLLGLENEIERAAFFALASLGYITNLVPVSDFLAQLGQAALGLPTLIIVLWAIALTAVGLQVLAALLFLGLTPALVWLFGLFGDSLRAVTTWLLMVGRAFLAAGVAAAAGALWLGMNVNGTLGRGLLGSLSMPFLSTALYFFLALVIWALWTRPALVVLYAGLPAAGRALAGLGAVTEGTGRVVSSLPGGQVIGPALAGVGGALRGWGQSAHAWRQRLEGVVGEDQGFFGPRLAASALGPEEMGLPEDPLAIEPVEDLGGLSEADGGGPIRRRIRVISESVGDLLEEALRQRYGDQYEQLVQRADGRTFLVPLDFNEKDKQFQSLYRRLAADRLPIIRRHGHYYAYTHGTWTRVPPRWAEASNALFLGDVAREGGRRSWSRNGTAGR